MAYLSSTTTSPNVPRCVVQGITGTKVFHYTSTQISSDVSFAGFFTDAVELGFTVGDQVIHHTSTGGIITSHSVLVVGSTTTALSVGTTIGLGS